MNRRDFLKLAGVSAGSALIGNRIVEALAAPDFPRVLNTPALADDRDPVAHVLNRVTFGPRPGQVDAVRKMGIQAYLEQQLDPQHIDDGDSDKRLSDFTTLNMNAVDMLAAGIDPQQVILELDTATVLRSVYSQRQLYEAMVNFWSEHFSIWILKETCKYLKTIDDRDVIRKNTFGKFRDLLGASAKSPAMLVYLDNAVSQKSHPNENYAREVMELHTLTPGNYTETDVKEVARCFTGWTVAGKNKPNAGEFFFNKNFHDDGEKTVLGHKIPAGGGIQDGEMVLDILASHPATAQHIATKLCRRFIADDPPDNVVQAAAAAFSSSGGDIPTVLRVIFAAPEFLNAPPKFKRPFEYLISLYRAFDVDLQLENQEKKLDRSGASPLGLLSVMGHLPFNHATPEGYSDNGAAWISDMLIRWNLPVVLVYGSLKDAKIDLTALAQSQNVEIKPRPALDFFAQLLLGRALTQAELDTIWGYASKNGEPDLTTEAGKLLMRDAISLIAASPAYQYR